MANMGKRQMVIMGVMMIAILYAAFDYLAPKKKNAGMVITQKTAELNTFLSDLATGLGKDTTKTLSALIFSRAEKEWAQDPFLDQKAYKAWTEVKIPPKGAVAAAVRKIEFIYTGYIELGGKRMAIINGSEYREGEELDIKGYTLKSVTQARVVVENRGMRTTLNIPLQE